MSLLIASPVYGSPVQSFVESVQRFLVEADIESDVLYVTGESLVQRARNNIVCSFLETGFERLLQIDSDLEFTTEDIAKLWNLDVDVCCASYPMKKVGIKTTAWKGGRLVDLDEFDGPVAIDYAATGFLMVKRKVFEDMREFYPHRKHMEVLPDGDFSSRRESFSWFDPRVTEGINPEDRVYLSEDYAFSADWRNMDGEIILEPSIRLKHYGIYGFGE